MNKSKPLLDVAADLRKLADSLQALANTFIESKPEPGRPEQAADKGLAIKETTLEQVRTVLADKSQDGFTSEVRALLEKHGAPRLSEIDPANYAALLTDAERLK